MQRRRSSAPCAPAGQAAASGAWLGQSQSRAVTFVSPGGAVFSSEAASLVVEVLDRPRELSRAAESVGEFDLLVPSGELVIEESGGGGGETILALPRGEWPRSLEWVR